VRQVVVREWLGQRRREAVTARVGHRRVLDGPGRDDAARVRVQFAQARHGLAPTHPAGDRQVDDGHRERAARRAGRRPGIQRLGPVGHRQHVVAHLVEHASQQVADAGLVIHHQHAPVHTRQRRGRRLLGSVRPRHAGRQQQGELGAAPEVGKHPHRAAVAGHDGIRDRQAQPGALGFRRVVRLEDAVEVGLRDAHAIVADADLDATAMAADQAVGRDVARGDPDAAALGHGLPRIDEQVADDLLDLGGVDLGIPQVVRQVALERHIRARHSQRRRTLQQVLQ